MFGRSIVELGFGRPQRWSQAFGHFAACSWWIMASRQAAMHNLAPLTNNPATLDQLTPPSGGTSRIWRLRSAPSASPQGPARVAAATDGADDRRAAVAGLLLRRGPERLRRPARSRGLPSSPPHYGICQRTLYSALLDPSEALIFSNVQTWSALRPGFQISSLNCSNSAAVATNPCCVRIAR